MYKQCNIQKIGRAGQSSFSSHEEDDILQRYRNIMNQQNNMILQQQHIGRVESDESLPTSLQRLQQPILVDIQDHVTRHKQMKNLKRQRRSNRKSRRSSSQHHRGRRSSTSSMSSEEESSSSTSSKGCGSLSEIVDVALTKMADVLFDSMPSCDSCADWMDASTPSKCSVFENRCM